MGSIVGFLALYISYNFVIPVLFMGFGCIAGVTIEKNKESAFRDSLTGLYNRRYFDDNLDNCLKISQRFEQSISLIMFDLDYFKSVNDTYGHLVGDKTLRAISNAAVKQCRSMDTIARYGGEEFVIVCPQTNQNEAVQLAERIRQKIIQLAVKELGFPGPQTISVGVISLIPTPMIEAHDIINRADNALYKAKKQGRNQTVIEN